MDTEWHSSCYPSKSKPAQSPFHSVPNKDRRTPSKTKGRLWWAECPQRRLCLSPPVKTSHGPEEVRLLVRPHDRDYPGGPMELQRAISWMREAEGDRSQRQLGWRKQGQRNAVQLSLRWREGPQAITYKNFTVYVDMYSIFLLKPNKFLSHFSYFLFCPHALLALSPFQNAPHNHVLDEAPLDKPCLALAA